MKKKFLTIATVCVATLCSAVSILSGCKGKEEDLRENATLLPYSMGITADGVIDQSMFYRNDMNIVSNNSFADPGAMYCEEDGYYYFYGTGMGCIRTKDYVGFENMGSVFKADSNAWSDGSYWAPEVIYDNVTQKYYLYYSATNKNVKGTNENGRHRIGIAVSDKPYGPFHEWEGTRSIPKRDATGKRVQENGADVFVEEALTVADCPIDFMQSPLVHEMGLNNFAMIDVHPFFDDNGDFYLYFARHKDDWNDKQGIWGVKMLDMVTPDYDTLKQLTEPARSTVGGELNFETNCTVNEGPFMIAHTTQKPNGEKVTKYYLTYTIYGYTNRLYSVCCAVSDSPLGEFVKLGREYGQPILGIDPDFDHMAGTGHHSFVKCGDEYFIAYHAFTNHQNIGDGRNIAFDRITFCYNEELGYDLMYSNGPTYSLQPLPYAVTGYKNLAKDAKITADNMAEGSSVAYLNDERVAINVNNEYDFVSVSNSVTITIDFGKEVVLSAIMVYNGHDINYAFSSIDVIRFESAEGNYYLENLEFPKDYISEFIMRPGGAAIAEFNEIKANKIKIKITKKIADEKSNLGAMSGISVSDIVVLGKQ